MSRDTIFYGRFPPDVMRKLVTEYDVRVVLSGETLESWMLPALKTGQYDAAIIAQDAPKAGQLAALIREQSAAADRRQHGLPVVEVDPDEGNVLRQILNATHWTPGVNTNFILSLCIKGGVGKSTLAAAVAKILSTERGHRVLLVDDNAAQGNALKIFTHRQGKLVAPTTPIKVSEFSRAQDILPARLVAVPDERGLDVCAVEDYDAQGGVTFGDALTFWAAVMKQGYDYIVVDTTPSMSVPERPEKWMNVSLAAALMIRADNAPVTLPAPAFAVSFTPVEWGWDGLEATRALLARWGLLDRMIPCVTAVDAEHILENVPDWLKEDSWRERLRVIPYNHRIQASPEVIREEKSKVKFWQDVRKHYRPVTDRLMGVRGDA